MLEKRNEAGIYLCRNKELKMTLWPLLATVPCSRSGQDQLRLDHRNKMAPDRPDSQTERRGSDRPASRRRHNSNGDVQRGLQGN